MTRPVPVVAALALGAALLLGGCEHNSWSCWGGGCHVTVNGTQNRLDIGEYFVTVSKITDRSATFSIDDSRPVEIPVGGTARVGDAKIKVTSIKGDTLKFDME